MRNRSYMTAMFQTKRKAFRFATMIIDLGGRALGPIRHPDFNWAVHYRLSLAA